MTHHGQHPVCDACDAAASREAKTIAALRADPEIRTELQRQIDAGYHMASLQSARDALADPAYARRVRGEQQAR